ncbi:hypothetical protein EB796_011668 [Bugula neritina]|uniref:Uncharacterized protein n=1 Tax=Bugula neritina TaxID=10212 RepID=A0A7J7JVN6_BUGNE|nr:hypothetical protein EB796_011668 [Bugula neritina]
MLPKVALHSWLTVYVTLSANRSFKVSPPLQRFVFNDLTFGESKMNYHSLKHKILTLPTLRNNQPSSTYLLGECGSGKYIIRWIQVALTR